MKKTSLCLVVILLFVLTGCQKVAEINERALVQAVGVDKTPDGYEVVIQYFYPEGPGAQGNIDVSKANSKMTLGKGATIDQALQDINSRQSKELFYDTNELIVFGHEMCLYGIGSAMDYFAKNSLARTGITVLSAEKDAKDIMITKINDAIVPAHAIELLIKSSHAVSKSVQSTMLNVYRGICNVYTNATDMACIKKFTTVDDKEGIETYGTDVFKFGKLVGTLNLQQTKGLLILRGALINETLVVDVPVLGKTSAVIKDAKSKYTVSVKDGKPHVIIDVTFSAGVSEIENHGAQLTTDLIDQVRIVCEQRINEIITKTLRELITTMNADIIKLSDRFMNKQPKYFKTVKDNWDEELKKMTFTVNVNGKTDRINIDLDFAY